MITTVSAQGDDRAGAIREDTPEVPDATQRPAAQMAAGLDQQTRLRPQPRAENGGPPSSLSTSTPRQVRRPAALGPLLAVAGVCGGAGASTLAYLVGRHAAEAARVPILVCDTGGPTATLAAYSRTEVPQSLPRVANAVVVRKRPPGAIFPEVGSGLRVLARRPGLDPKADPDGLARVLQDARAAHSLTIVDCGSLRTETDRQVLALASHVVWVVPATAVGVSRGAAVLPLFELPESPRQALVARHDPAARKPPIKELTALAESRRAPLVLMPSVPDLAQQPVGHALETAAAALEAIQSVIR